MPTTILHRYTGAVLFTSSADTVAKALVEAVAAKADLMSANLSGANLMSADLSGADLRSADLSGADLRSADLRSAKTDAGTRLPAFQIPQEGELIVWKSVRGGVCKLRVPPEAKRTASVVGRKCRAEWVEVLEAPADGRGRRDPSVVYRTGETVRPNSYDPNPLIECTSGIHFFLTREEAEAY